jgi:aspartate 1-decarboxylase
VHHATGERFTTFAQPAAEGSGEVSVHGVRAGDVVSIFSWGLMHDGQTLAHTANVVELDAENRVVAITAAVSS